MEYQNKKAKKTANISICLIVFLVLPLSTWLTLMAEGHALIASEDASLDIGINSQLAESWYKKGNDFYVRDNYVSAIRCYRKALELLPMKIVYIDNLAKAYSKNRQFDHAIQLLNDSLSKFSKKEDCKQLQIWIAQVHIDRAKELENKKDYKNAFEHYNKAYHIDKTYRKWNTAWELKKIAELFSKLGKKQEAVDVYSKALIIYEAGNNRIGKAKILYEIGNLRYSLGHKRKALEQYKEALIIFQSVNNKVSELMMHLHIGKLYSEIGQKRESLPHLEKVAQIFGNKGFSQGKANTLYTIGHKYFHLGEKQKAIEYYEKALSLSKILQNHKLKATILYKIGYTYSHLNQSQKALEYFMKALPVQKLSNTPALKPQILYGIAINYQIIGQKQNALEYYKKTLSLMKILGNHTDVANISHKIGHILSDSGQKGKAMGYYKDSLSIYQKANNTQGEAEMFNCIGNMYYELHQQKKAMEYYKKSLSLSRNAKDRGKEAVALANIGHMYSHLGQKENSLHYHDKSLLLTQEVGNTNDKATLLDHIGKIYLANGQQQKALEYHKKALHIHRTSNDRRGIAITLSNIGHVYFKSGLNLKALEYYEKVLQSINELGNESIQVNPLDMMMTCEYNLKNPELSIFYGKLSVNLTQKLRENISNFDKEIRKKYFESNNHAYKHTAGLLIQNGRIAEAQQILNMLKGEEYLNFIHWARSNTPTPYSDLDLTAFERKWMNKYNDVTFILSSVSRKYHFLNSKTNKSESEQNKLDELEAKLKEARKSYEIFFTQMKAAFARHQKKMEENLQTPILTKEAKQLQSTLKYLDETQDGKTVALHYLIGDERISVIVTTSKSQSVIQTQFDEKELSQMIMIYKTLVVELATIKREKNITQKSIRNIIVRLKEINRGVDPLPPHTGSNLNDKIEGLFQIQKENEKKLYEIIFKPIEPELKKYGATNLVLSLDGVLRYTPFSTLWDGQYYLLQRYRIALITPSSLKNINDAPMEEKKILGFGAGNGGQGFSKLPHVAREIRSIVRDEERGYFGLVDGRAFINSKFTRDAMIDQLKTGDSPLVHISSHFKFSPGDETKNKLLLGDGNTIKLSEIRKEGKLFDGVKLLVLSACETGIGGNGEEIDGFGEMAQQSGAKSVIASLWPVADESTKNLMVYFYRNLTNGKTTSKIEALRQAQLELAGLDDLLTNNSYSSPLGDSQEKKTKYPHSYYWGPFIMIGNWR